MHRQAKFAAKLSPCHARNRMWRSTALLLLYSYFRYFWNTRAQRGSILGAGEVHRTIVCSLGSSRTASNNTIEFTSALRLLQPYTLLLCLFVLFLLTFANLRGLRESGFAFMPPTYLFVGCLALVLVIGIVKASVSGGHPHPVNPLPPPSNAHEQVTLWLFLKAFAAGCTAMTGVEAGRKRGQTFTRTAGYSARPTSTLIVRLPDLLVLSTASFGSDHPTTSHHHTSP